MNFKKDYNAKIITITIIGTLLLCVPVYPVRDSNDTLRAPIGQEYTLVRLLELMESQELELSEEMAQEILNGLDSNNSEIYNNSVKLAEKFRGRLDNIKGIIFDIGGVLLRPDKDALEDNFRKTFGELDLGQYTTEDRLKELAARFRAEREDLYRKERAGKMTFDGYVSVFNNDYLEPAGIPVELSPLEYATLFNWPFTGEPGMLDMLRRLKAGFRFKILSDQHSEGSNWSEADEVTKNINEFYPGIFEEKDHIRSFVTGHTKHDPEAFDIALKEIGLNAGEVVFIDDKPGFTRVARHKGMLTSTVDTSEVDLKDNFLLNELLTGEWRRKVSRQQRGGNINLSEESNARCLFEGLKLSYKETLATMEKYPHLELRFMLPVQGEVIQESINPAIQSLSREELNNIGKRFVVGPHMDYEDVSIISSELYPCFQVLSHYRKPYFILPGDGIVVDLPNGKKKKLRYIGYLGGGLVFSKQERDRRRYTADVEPALIYETFGRGYINNNETNLGLASDLATKKRFAVLKDMLDKGETDIPLYLLITRLITVRDTWGKETKVSDLQENERIIPDQNPVVALIGYEGLETIRDLDFIIYQQDLRLAVERNKEQAQEREGQGEPFSDEEFLVWFADKHGGRLARLINLGIERGNLSPQNTTFFEITDFDNIDTIEGLKMQGYDDNKVWEMILFEHFFQGYVTLSSTFKLFSEKLGVDKKVWPNLKSVYFAAILEQLNKEERKALIKQIRKNTHIRKEEAMVYFETCNSNYKVLLEFIKGFEALLERPGGLKDIPRPSRVDI